MYDTLYSKKELQQIDNYGKLIWYDTQEYTEIAKSLWIKTSKAILTSAKEIDNDSFPAHRENEIDTSEGDFKTQTPKSLQYEEAINDLLLWYKSKTGKNIKPNKQLKDLKKPINKQYIVKDINTLLIAKSENNKGKKRFEDNPFLSDFTKRGGKSPLVNLTNKILQHHQVIKQYETGLDELKAKYTKNGHTKDREQYKRIQLAMQKFIH